MELDEGHATEGSGEGEANDDASTAPADADDDDGADGVEVEAVEAFEEDSPGGQIRMSSNPGTMTSDRPIKVPSDATKKS